MILSYYKIVLRNNFIHLVRIEKLDEYCRRNFDWNQEQEEQRKQQHGKKKQQIRQKQYSNKKARKENPNIKANWRKKLKGCTFDFLFSGKPGEMICWGKGGGELCDALVCHPGRSTNYKCCYSLHAMETRLGSGWMGGPPGSSTHLTHLLLIQALKSWLYNLIMRLRKVLKRTVAGGSEVWRSNNFCRSHISSSGRGKEFLANQALNVWSWKLRYWWVVKLSYWFSETVAVANARPLSICFTYSTNKFPREKTTTNLDELEWGGS